MLVLVADRNMEAAVAGLLSRHQALGIRPVAADIRRHPERDSGCRTGGAEFLSALTNQYDHALLMFDYDGCGEEGLPVEELEKELEMKLSQVGWANRSAVIVLDPELEIWVWGDSPHLDAELGWAGRSPGLKPWLQEQGLWSVGQSKPPHPKGALAVALREVRKARSSAIYQSLAEKVSVKRCTDRGFLKLRGTLQKWFGETEKWQSCLGNPGTKS